MDDLIRRSDAIRLIKRWMVRLDDVDASEKTEISGYNLGLLTAEREVSTLPAVEPTTKVVAQVNVDTEDVVRRIKEEYDIIDGWIPCEERLPKPYTEVLVSDDCGWIALGAHRPCDVSEDCSGWSIHSKVKIGTEEVIAWMPLPEPYMKGADE